MRLRTLVPTLLAAGLAVAGVQSCSPQPERAPSVREPKQSADAGSPPTAAADLSSLRTAQRAAPPPAGTEERAFADAPPGRRLERSRASGAGWAAPAGALAHQADADLPRLGAGEELWVVARADWDGAPPPASAPVYGGLEAMRGGDPVPLPLEHTDVQASIAGYIASVRVRQRYANPYGEKIEARYVFPLPQDAAVSDFVMTVGERHIRGIIRERQQAERIYAEARQQGYVTSLLTQERPNVFTQSVANIEPGTRIDVDLTYYNPLAYHDGDYEFVFPMVVGPRFNPPGSSGGIGAVPAGSGGASGQATEVQYLPPDRRSGHDIALQVDLDAGMAIEAVDSPTHAIDSTAPDSTRRRVTLRGADTVPNKDFVLRYRLAGGAVKTALLTHRDQRGGFFTLLVQPPADLAAAPRAPMELVFVLDCSGSMAGEPLAIAKRAAARALRRLGPDDTFQVIQFSTSAAQLGPHPIPATPENLARGLAYLESLQSEGGTMMIEGIKAALDFPHDPRRLRVVSFMTDGYIGNDAEILGEVQRRVRDARIFSFGIGSSTNRYLLDRMALLGRGAVAYVGLDEGSQRAVDQFYERVSHPALTDVTIDWGDLRVSEVYPARVPDLFVGRPVVLTGRYQGRGAATVHISGRAGGEVRQLAVSVDASADAPRPALASIWARAKIAELENAATVAAPGELEPQITKVALAYGLMSAYTAFVAVDSSHVTAGDHGTTVVVPVPVPDGVRYDTTVPGAAPPAS